MSSFLWVFLLFLVISYVKSIKPNNPEIPELDSKQGKLLKRAIKILSNPRHRDFKEDLEQTFKDLDKKHGKIFDSSSTFQCLEKIATHGLIKLVYEKMQKKYPKRFKRDILMAIVQIGGHRLCEFQSIKETEEAFRGLSEHQQNEIIDTVLRIGNESGAWDLPSVDECLQYIKDNVLDDIHKELRPKFPQLRTLKELILGIAETTCESWKNDKRDL